MRATNPMQSGVQTPTPCNPARTTTDGAAGELDARARVMCDQETAEGVTSVAALLRSLRTERDMSTRRLAKRSATARSTITRLEEGLFRPRRSLLSALALGLDVDHRAELRERLVQAAGAALVPDTPGTLRWRQRRLERGVLAGEVPLPSAVSRRIELHRRADALYGQAMAMLDVPGAYDDVDVLDEAMALMAESRHLSAEAGPPVSLQIGTRRYAYGFRGAS